MYQGHNTAVWLVRVPIVKPPRDKPKKRGIFLFDTALSFCYYWKWSSRTTVILTQFFHPDKPIFQVLPISTPDGLKVGTPPLYSKKGRYPALLSDTTSEISCFEPARLDKSTYHSTRQYNPCLKNDVIIKPGLYSWPERCGVSHTNFSEGKTYTRYIIYTYIPGIYLLPFVSCKIRAKKKLKPPLFFLVLSRIPGWYLLIVRTCSINVNINT